MDDDDLNTKNTKWTKGTKRLVLVGRFLSEGWQEDEEEERGHYGLRGLRGGGRMVGDVVGKTWSWGL